MKYIKPHVLQAIAWYPFNTAHNDIIRTVYGTNHHEKYIEEKTDLLNKRGLLWFFGQLDGLRRERLCMAIEQQYWKYLEEHDVQIDN